IAVVLCNLHAAHAQTRCQTLTASDPNILFCEDFENPAFNQAGPITPSTAWYQRFGGATGFNGQPGCEGPTGTCIVDVVAAGQCNAPGESGSSCIFDGSQSLGFPYRAEVMGGGNLGEFNFGGSQTYKTFGVTLALRMSP